MPMNINNTLIITLHHLVTAQEKHEIALQCAGRWAALALEFERKSQRSAQAGKLQAAHVQQKIAGLARQAELLARLGYCIAVPDRSALDIRTLRDRLAAGSRAPYPPVAAPAEVEADRAA